MGKNPIDEVMQRGCLGFVLLIVLVPIVVIGAGLIILYFVTRPH